MRADFRTLLQQANIHVAALAPCPSCASRMEAARPQGPPPTTTTSNSMLSRALIGRQFTRLGTGRKKKDRFAPAC